MIATAINNGTIPKSELIVAALSTVSGTTFLLMIGTASETKSITAMMIATKPVMNLFKLNDPIVFASFPYIAWPYSDFDVKCLNRTTITMTIETVITTPKSVVYLAASPPNLETPSTCAAAIGTSTDAKKIIPTNAVIKAVSILSNTSIFVN